MKSRAVGDTIGCKYERLLFVKAIGGKGSSELRLFFSQKIRAEAVSVRLLR